mmetsp:Transcript_27927/g.66492  ORF Transcript_27927/g.66492 Transcript_27927/m.66492 type:complete len:263 (+) Transcript_27927:329-1117(+)
MKHTPVLSLGPVSAACGLSVITLLGLRSPCPKTTGGPSSSKRVRMRATSSATSCRHMPSGTACGRFSTCTSMLFRNSHSTTGGCAVPSAAEPVPSPSAALCGKSSECKPASLEAMRRSSHGVRAWMSRSDRSLPGTNSVIRPSSDRKRTRGPKPASPASSSPRPRSGAAMRILARGEKTLPSTEQADASACSGRSTRYTQLQNPAESSTTVSGSTMSACRSRLLSPSTGSIPSGRLARRSARFRCERRDADGTHEDNRRPGV